MVASNSPSQLLENSPSVTICIPTYNAENTIRETLDSITNQTYKNCEILIIDNASTDKTLEIIEKHFQREVRLLRNETNIGAENNWNRCIAEAKGDYIAIFHADDVYCPTIVEEELKCFSKNPDLGAVFTSASFIDENGVKFGEYKNPLEEPKRKKITFSDAFPVVLEYWNIFLCPSAMVKRHVYQECYPFRYQMFRTSSDLDMWFRIMEKYPVTILEKQLFLYRISSTQGNFRYNYRRVENADFFKVMDYYLGKYRNRMKLPRKALDKYKIFKLSDDLTIIKNYYLLGEPGRASNLVKNTISWDNFILVLRNCYRLDTLFRLVLLPVISLFKYRNVKGISTIETTPLEQKSSEIGMRSPKL